jgi:hypothetical protein
MASRKEWTPRLLDEFEKEFADESFFIDWVIGSDEESRASSMIYRKWRRRAGAYVEEDALYEGTPGVHVDSFRRFRELVRDLSEAGILTEPGDKLLLDPGFQDSVFVDGRGTLREFIEREAEQAWDPEEPPMISIEEGELQVQPGGDQRTRLFPATKAGARAVGKLLRQKGVQEWLHSSSVDFPHEYGAPKLDFRDLIREGYEA